jgi:hypothetical protein
MQRISSVLIALMLSAVPALADETSSSDQVVLLELISKKKGQPSQLLSFALTVPDNGERTDVEMSSPTDEVEVVLRKRSNRMSLHFRVKESRKGKWYRFEVRDVVPISSKRILIKSVRSPSGRDVKLYMTVMAGSVFKKLPPPLKVPSGESPS